jgi:hypothetical protein
MAAASFWSCAQSAARFAKKGRVVGKDKAERWIAGCSHRRSGCSVNPDGLSDVSRGKVE